jgi:hypothetical protein
MCFVLAFSGSLKDTRIDIFPMASISLPPNPMSGESEGYSYILLSFIWSKALAKMMLAELPESTSTLLIPHPAMFALITMASVWG